jgi:hypothetical protein
MVSFEQLLIATTLLIGVACLVATFGVIVSYVIFTNKVKQVLEIQDKVNQENRDKITNALSSFNLLISLIGSNGSHKSSIKNPLRIIKDETNPEK